MDSSPSVPAMSIPWTTTPPTRSLTQSSIIAAHSRNSTRRSPSTCWPPSTTTVWSSFTCSPTTRKGSSGRSPAPWWPHQSGQSPKPPAAQTRGSWRGSGTTPPPRPPSRSMWGMRASNLNVYGELLIAWRNGDIKLTFIYYLNLE